MGPLKNWVKLYITIIDRKTPSLVDTVLLKWNKNNNPISNDTCFHPTLPSTHLTHHLSLPTLCPSQWSKGERQNLGFSPGCRRKKKWFNFFYRGQKSSVYLPQKQQAAEVAEVRVVIGCPDNTNVLLQYFNLGNNIGLTSYTHTMYFCPVGNKQRNKERTPSGDLS